MKPLALAVCVALLVGGATPAHSQQEEAPSVREYQLEAFENVSKAIADGCTESYPALKEAFDEAIISLKRRADAVMDALLETGQFRHLANAMVPRQMVENLAANLDAFRREAATMPEAQCKQAISDMAMGDEQLRAMLANSLEIFDRCLLDPSCIGP